MKAYSSSRWSIDSLLFAVARVAAAPAFMLLLLRLQDSQETAITKERSGEVEDCQHSNVMDSDNLMDSENLMESLSEKRNRRNVVFCSGAAVFQGYIIK